MFLNRETARPGMGLFSSVSVIVGACIGSAIFSISGMTVYIAGAGSVLSWVLAAVVMGAYGLIVTRLAVHYPRSGGVFVFPRLVYGGKTGRALGFFSAWGYIVSNCIAIGFSAIVAGVYFAAGFPELCDSCHSSLVASLCAMVVSAVILLVGGRRSQLTQNALVILLVFTLLTYCLTTFTGDGFDLSAVIGGSVGISGPVSGTLSTVPLAMVAYGGCVAIAFMISEVRNPSRNVPRSLWLGLGVVAVLYAAVIVAIVGTLPVAVLANNPSLRYSPLMTSLNLGSAAGEVALDRLVAVSSILAQLTTIIVLTRINARAVQAMASDGFFPAGLSYENRRGVLSPAIFLMTAIGIAICFMHRWAWQIITLGAALNVVSIIITCATGIKLALTRNLSQRKKLSRIIFPSVVLVLLLIFYLPDIFNGDSLMWVFTAITYLVGIVVLFIASSVDSAPPAMETPSRFALSGIVIHGKGVGHKHGIPTANLSTVVGQKLPEYGVWVTKVLLDGVEYKGLTNVGLRPTDDDIKTPTVETIIIGFDSEREIYGHAMTLEFLRYLRPTMKFSSLDELKLQIDRDMEVI